MEPRGGRDAARGRAQQHRGDQKALSSGRVGFVALGHEIDDADAELEGIRGQIGTLESRKDEIENRIKLLIGSHAGGVTPQGTRFTWKGSEVHHKPREASVSYVRRFLRSKAR